MTAISKPWRWAACIALTALVIALTTAPGNPQPGDSAFVWAVDQTPTVVQKSMHMVAYAALFAVWHWAIDATRSLVPITAALAIALIVFGAILEYVQLSIPGRFGTLFDVGLNTAGVLAGVALIAMRGPTPNRDGRAR